jgi:release factor glutamine methyltransferase
MTAAGLLSEAAATLAAAGVAAPEWDAERLLRHVLEWDRATLVASPAAEVPGEQAARFRAFVARRAAREPLQYLLGSQAFWKHEFLVTPDVLIPRPETELLVEVCLDLVRDTERPLMVDVGTGSGCIALSLAFERTDAVVHATDFSEPALDVARENARRLGLEGRVTFHHGQLLEPLGGLEVQLVASNPPYVDRADRVALAPEVRDHEPEAALFPPGDALAVYRRLVPASAALLPVGGALAVEVSPFLVDDVVRLFGEAGFPEPAVRPDLAGLSRVVFGRRSRLPRPAPVG